ncbi:MAG TPA: hypothetical protein VJG66_02820 [Patescibacteria group bacterium]|nr:hypothetical protein [Patescibacteria group bacterium]
MFDEKFVLLALLLNTYGDMKYLVATVKGTIKPNKVSWLFWAIAPMTAFAGEIAKGVGWASIMTLSVGLNPLLIFFASFLNKKAQWKISKFDTACGLLSLVGIFLWFLTSDANLAIFFAILADVAAAAPTLIKSYYHPKTENASPFIFAVLAAIVTLLTIKEWNFANYGFPVFILFSCLVFVLLIQFQMGKYIRKFKM